jgi:type 1 glutamine amidotransferase
LSTPILLVSDGIVHPSLLGRFWLRRALRALPGYHFRRVASLEALPDLALASFRALVLYVHHKTLSLPALGCLETFVRQGGGLLGVHSASASFKQEDRYFEILGGRFVGHGPVETFQLQPATPQDVIFGGIAAFSVRDELYRHEYDPDNRVHFFALVGGEREPQVWTRRYGQGRVCYCALGHTAAAMRHPSVWEILQRGLAWVCDTPPGGGEQP